MSHNKTKPKAELYKSSNPTLSSPRLRVGHPLSWSLMPKPKWEKMGHPSLLKRGT